MRIRYYVIVADLIKIKSFISVDCNQINRFMYIMYTVYVNMLVYLT